MFFSKLKGESTFHNRHYLFLFMPPLHGIFFLKGNIIPKFLKHVICLFLRFFIAIFAAINRKP